MKNKVALKINTSNVFGMWKDRLDMKNKTSVDWVNENRLKKVCRFFTKPSS